MKASEIRSGIKVGVVSAGRNPKVEGRGVVLGIAERTQTYYAGNRKQTYARVHIHDKDWQPMNDMKYEGGRWIEIPGEPMVKSFRIQQLISEAVLNERADEQRKRAEENARRRQMVEDVKEGLLAVLERAGVERDDVSVFASFSEADENEPEGVQINGMRLQAEGVTALMNFIGRELPLVEMEEGQ